MAVGVAVSCGELSEDTAEWFPFLFSTSKERGFFLLMPDWLPQMARV